MPRRPQANDRFSLKMYLKMMFFILNCFWCIIQSVSTLESKISVDCQPRTGYLIVKVKTDLPFTGQLYASNGFNNPNCSTLGNGNLTTTLKIPFKGCNTTQTIKGSFMNRVTVQQHPLIVSSGDGEYDVACKMFVGDLKVDSQSHMAVSLNKSSNKSSSKDNGTSATVAPPKVLLRIYDFENDVFVDTVQLGQVVELEVTIRDGNIYKGRLSECDAVGGSKTIPVIRNFCPVDLNVSDKVYVDDQSRTTSDFYLYVPFQVFRFLDGRKVSFTCRVIICHDPEECPQADCGNFTGMSYGRRRRSTYDLSSGNVYSVQNEVTVVDDMLTHMSIQHEKAVETIKDKKLEETLEVNTLHSKWFWNAPVLSVFAILTLSLLMNAFLLKTIRKRSAKITSSTQVKEEEVMTYNNEGFYVEKLN